jgi:hypothetical protein
VSTKTGAAGEFIVCSSILQLNGNWKIVHTPQDRIDVLAFDDAFFLRISVKTSRINNDTDGRNPSYHFQNGSGSKNKILPNAGEIDIVAHCFLDDRRVGYYAAEEVRKYSQRRPLHYACAPCFEQDTWDRAVQIVQGRLR